LSTAPVVGYVIVIVGWLAVIGVVVGVGPVMTLNPVTVKGD